MAEDPLVALMDDLRTKAKRLRFAAPVAYVYNPLDYAWPVARDYFVRFGRAPKEVLLLGMNPGPFGMAQTGVPFGEVSFVRDYLKLSGPIGSPHRTHPKRPIEGFSCARSEVSGQRLWGAIAAMHPSPDSFFDRAFVLNYCPLVFLGESGANITPDKLARAEREKLEALCDRALGAAIRHLSPRMVVGVGQYAAKRAALVVPDVPVATMPHPSPASPAANRGWAKLARQALEDAGLDGLL